MPLITDLYRAQQAKLHAEQQDESFSAHYAPLVRETINRLTDVTTVLDYGCGKGRLGMELMKETPDRSVTMEQYDPAITEFCEPPDPCDLVVCVDVLEHIEPECLQDVLRDLRRCARKYLLTTIQCGPAMKKLDDGRNAHLIQAPPEQWCGEFWMLRFTLMSYGESAGGFWALWRAPSGTN